MVWSRLTRNRPEVSPKSNLEGFVDSQVKGLKDGGGVGWHSEEDDLVVTAQLHSL